MRKTPLKMVVKRIYQGQEGIQRGQVIIVFFILVPGQEVNYLQLPSERKHGGK